MSITLDGTKGTYYTSPEDATAALSSTIASLCSKSAATAFNAWTESLKKGKRTWTKIPRALEICAAPGKLNAILDVPQKLSVDKLYCLRILGIDLYRRMHGPESEMLAHNTYKTSDFTMSQLAILRGSPPVDFAKFVTVELNTSKPVRSRGRRGRKRRREEASDPSGDESDEVTRSKRALVTPEPEQTSLIKYPTRTDALNYLNQWSDPQALDALPALRNIGIIILMSGTTKEAFLLWLQKLCDSWIEVQRTQLISQAQLPVLQETTKMELAKASQEASKATQCEVARKRALIEDRKAKRADNLTARKHLIIERESKTADYAETLRIERENKQQIEEAKQKMKMDAEFHAAKLETLKLKAKRAAPAARFDHQLPLPQDAGAAVKAAYAGDLTGVMLCKGVAGAKCSERRVVSIFNPSIVRLSCEGRSRVCCLRCAAEASHAGELSHRVDWSTSRKRQLVWYNRNGGKPSALCCGCDVTEIFAGASDWDAGHDVANAEVADSGAFKLFPLDLLCNRDQFTLSLDAWRMRKGLIPIVRRNAIAPTMRNGDAGRALAYAYAGKGTLRETRRRLETLSPPLTTITTFYR